MTSLKSLLAATSLLAMNTSHAAVQDMTIRSDQGADRWDYGYPIGNGRIGLLSLGDFPSEKLYLNENSIWARQEVNPPSNAQEAIREVRALATAGKYQEADSLMTNKLLEPVWRPASYEFAGMATIDHLNAGEAQSIKNSLDLTTGLNRSEATYGDGIILRESVALRDRDVIAMRISTTRKAGLNFKVGLTHPRDSVSIEGNRLILTGQAATGGTCYQSQLLLRPSNHVTHISSDNESLQVKGGTEIILLFTAATDYNIKGPDQPLTDWQGRIDEYFSRAAQTDWETLSAEAQAEMHSYMDRCTLDLGQTVPEIRGRTTEERIKNYKDGGADPELETMLFQFGRYALVASNREDGLPNNLQGIWSEGIIAPWSGDYHLNINLQMNYWPSEPTGLGELHMPFLNLVRDMQPGGQALTKSLGYEGFASGHAINAFKNTWFSGGKPLWGASLMNGAWITAHLMEHYRYSGDREFLANKAWPLIEANSRFILSWIQRDETTGEWVTGPGTSPENEFYYMRDEEKVQASISIGTTHDLMLAWESLSDLIEAADILGKENELIQQARVVLPNLAEGKVGSDGRMQEWREPFIEKNLGHRHVSHAYGLFPGRQYNAIQHPEKVAAISKSIDFRLANGGGPKGWSRAWLINIEACMMRPEGAYDSIRALLSRLVNPNLFDMHPPFQIDGNLGYTAGVCTMLLQSHIQLESGERVLTLLPALPEAWPEGEVRGLRARGGAIIDLKWTPSSVTASITTNRHGIYQVRYGDQILPLELKGAEHTEVFHLKRLRDSRTRSARKNNKTPSSNITEHLH